MRMPHIPHIVVIGGGFGGVYTVLELDRQLRRIRTKANITLLSKDNFLLFTPMLHEVASSSIALQNIVMPLRKMVRSQHVEVITGTVTGIDAAARRITVEHGSDQHCHELTYDHVVIAVGSATNYFDIPGLAEHSFTLKTLRDAMSIRTEVIALLERAEADCETSVRTEPLRIIVGGGGFAGTETVGALHDLVERSVPYYPKLATTAIEVHLIEGNQHILPELGGELGDYAARKLQERDITLHLGWRITSVSNAAVTISQSETTTELPYDLLVWTGGIGSNPLLAYLNLPIERGRLSVTPQLHTPDDPHIWAVGDCAAVPQSTGGIYPPTAQHAIRQAPVAARNIIATLRKSKLQPYTYRDIGALASIGERTGVARIFGVQFSGFLAWWMWRTVYLMKLPGIEKRVRVAVDWTVDLFFGRDIVQYLPQRSKSKRD
jgi:NADH:ubiquinone reductase (H+-translocating)